MSIREKINPLSSFPPFENHYANKQRMVSIISVSVIASVTIICAMYHLLIFDSRSSAYLIAMLSWVPLFLVGFFTTMRSYKIQNLSKSNGVDEYLREFTHRTFFQSIILTSTMTMVVILFAILL